MRLTPMLGVSVLAALPTAVAVAQEAELPPRASSQPLVGEHADLGIDMTPHMPTSSENAQTAFLFNYTWWADHRDELDARFQAWLGQ
jgi:hypothetical protein